MGNSKILFVDDDEKILNGIDRQLGDDFDLSLALGPRSALEMLDEEGPFAVVVSDMRMPEINGVELLRRVREKSPNTVRMILTGYAELNSTIAAINEGHIFRFLAKPCSPEDLAHSLNDGLRQFSLIEAEQELLEGTLSGSLKVLSDVLALVSPLAFGQSTRVNTTVDGMIKRLDLENQWQMEIAAMLVSLGCVMLPPDIVEKKLSGLTLTPQENSMYESHPQFARDLLRGIPRLEKVAEIIGMQNVSAAISSVQGNPVPLESRILKLAIDFDMYEMVAESSLDAIAHLEKNSEPYQEQ